MDMNLRPTINRWRSCYGQSAFSEIIVNKEIDVLIYTRTQRQRERNASLGINVNRKIGVHIYTQNQMKNQKTRRKKLTMPVM